MKVSKSNLKDVDLQRIKKMVSNLEIARVEIKKNRVREIFRVIFYVVLVYVKLQKQRILQAREAMVEQKSRAREERERAEMATKLQMDSFIAMKNRNDGQMATEDLKPKADGIARDSNGDLVIPIEDAIRSIYGEDDDLE